jgi:hypothetical protein
VGERSILDYKQALPGGKDQDIHEFLADVSSMANAYGGHLIYGVADRREGNESTGEPDRIVGLGGNFNSDAVVASMENRLRNALEPPLEVEFQAVETALGAVLVLRVPRSWQAPHRIRSSSRFYGRGATGKYPMSVDHLRIAFDQSTAAAERLNQRREERVVMLREGRTPTGIIAAGPMVVLHGFPLSAGWLRATTAHVPALTMVRKLGVFYGHGFTGATPNFDGALAYDGGRRGAVTSQYAQVFRDGAVEWVNKSLCEDGHIPWPVLAESLLKSVRSVLSLAGELPQLVPCAFMLSLLNVRGHHLLTHDRHEGVALDRDHLLFPPVLIDRTIDPAAALRPLFDALWQSAGFEACADYDDDGKWAPQR